MRSTSGSAAAGGWRSASIGRAASLLEDYGLGSAASTCARARWVSRVSPIVSSWSRPFDLLLVLRSNPEIKLNRLLAKRAAQAGNGGVRRRLHLGAQGVVRASLFHPAPGAGRETCRRLRRARGAEAGADARRAGGGRARRGGAHPVHRAQGPGRPRRMVTAGALRRAGARAASGFPTACVVLGSGPPRRWRCAMRWPPRPEG